MARTVHEWAKWYTSVGLSVIPVRCDGSKAPAQAEWRQYTDRLATDDELADWYGERKDKKEYGIGIVPGPASGNLCVLDFEYRNGVCVYDQWAASLSPHQAEVLNLCPIIATPSGGRHVWVRTQTPQRGGILARDESGILMIEIRGLGNQVLAPGCPEKCHKSGKAYTFLSMGWLPKWS